MNSTSVQPAQPTRSASTIIWLIGLIIVPLIRVTNADDNIIPHRFLAWALFIMLMLLLRSRTISSSISELKAATTQNKIFGGALAALAAYLLFGAISIVGSVNPGEGIYELCKLVSVAIFALVSYNVLRESQFNFSLLSKTIVVLALLMCAMGILQFYRIGFMNMCDITVIPCGMMGNRNLLASFVMLCMPFALYLVLTEKDIWRVISVFGTGISIFTILVSQTRSIYLVLVLSVVATAIFLYSSRSVAAASLSKKYVLIGGLVLAVVFVAAVSTDSFSLRQRLTTGWSGDAKTSSIAERVLMAEKSVRMTKEHWLTGVGLGNWKLHFTKYGLLGSRMDQGTINFVQPHNDYLWISSEMGVFGLLTYLVLLGLFFALLIKKLPSIQAFCLLLMLMSFSIDAAFSFPKERIEHLMMFSLIIAGTLVLAAGEKVQKSRTDPAQKVSLAYYPLAGLALAILWVTWMRSQDDHNLYKVKVAQLQKNNEAMLAESMKINTFITSTDALANPVGLYKGMAEMGLNRVDAAIASFEQGKQKNPGSLAVLNQLAYAYVMKKDYINAINLYEYTLKVSPEFQSSIIGLSIAHYGKGDLRKAMEIINTGDRTNDMVNYYRGQFEKAYGAALNRQQ